MAGTHGDTAGPDKFRRPSRSSHHRRGSVAPTAWPPSADAAPLSVRASCPNAQGPAVGYIQRHRSCTDRPSGEASTLLLPHRRKQHAVFDGLDYFDPRQRSPRRWPTAAPNWCRPRTCDYVARIAPLYTTVDERVRSAPRPTARRVASTADRPPRRPAQPPRVPGPARVGRAPGGCALGRWARVPP